MPNPNWWGDPPKTERILITGFADQETEIAAIKSGEVDFIYPQFLHGHRPTRSPTRTWSRAIELRWRLRGAVLPDGRGRGLRRSVRRRRLSVMHSSKSIDRDALFAQIYAPLVDGAELLSCGPIVPGTYCTDASAATTSTTQAAAEQILTDAGWAKNGDGILGEGRRRPRDPLDGQHRQHPA